MLETVLHELITTGVSVFSYKLAWFENNWIAKTWSKGKIQGDNTKGKGYMYMHINQQLYFRQQETD